MLHYLASILSVLSMILLPVVAGAVVARRLRVGWGLFGAGALTFVLSQVVHIPLNWAVAQGFAIGAFPSLPESVTWWLLPLGLGVSAGLCEETARWVGLRFFLKERRAWHEGLMYGVGHGGVESMIVGGLGILTVVNLMVLSDADLGAMGVPVDQIPTVEAGLAQYWSTPWYVLFVGAFERITAMICHVGMTLLVLQAVVRGQIHWYFAAVLFHTALNTGALLLLPYGIAAAEGWVLLLALGAIAWVVALRPRAPSDAGPASPPFKPLTVERVSLEESARSLDEP